MLGPTPRRKARGFLMFSAATVQEVEKGAKMGALGLPGRIVKLAITKAAVMRAEVAKKMVFSAKDLLSMAKRRLMMRVGMTKARRITADPAGERKTWVFWGKLGKMVVSQRPGPRLMVSNMAVMERITPLATRVVRMCLEKLVVVLVVVATRKRRKRKMGREVVETKPSRNWAKEPMEETRVMMTKRNRGRVKGERVTRKDLVRMFLIIQMMTAVAAAMPRKMVLERTKRLAEKGLKKMGRKKTVMRMMAELAWFRVLMSCLEGFMVCKLNSKF